MQLLLLPLAVGAATAAVAGAVGGAHQTHPIAAAAISVERKFANVIECIIISKKN